MGYINITAHNYPRKRWTKLNGLRGLGAVLSVPLRSGGMIYSSSPTYRSNPIRVVGPARYIPHPSQTPTTNPPGWGGGYSGGGYSGGGYGWSTASDNPSSPNNLAQLLLQYQSNPSSLTAQQWQQLQAAGAIPATNPYSNASLTQSSSGMSASGIDPATGVSYATELAAAQAASSTASSSSVIGTDPTTGATTILGIDWYWLAGGAVLLFLFTGKRR
jgi:hypothetical protein